MLERHGFCTHSGKRLLLGRPLGWIIPLMLQCVWEGGSTLTVELSDDVYALL